MIRSAPVDQRCRGQAPIKPTGSKSSTSDGVPGRAARKRQRLANNPGGVRVLFARERRKSGRRRATAPGPDPDRHQAGQTVGGVVANIAPAADEIIRDRDVFALLGSNERLNQLLAR